MTVRADDGDPYQGHVIDDGRSSPTLDVRRGPGRRLLAAWAELPANVRTLGWVSLANDAGSELAYPLLLKHEVKATIFLPVAYVGGVNQWDGGAEPLMPYEVLLKVAGRFIEFGLHSYRHENYERYTAVQMEADVSKCVSILTENGCPFSRVFAYPYGRVPKGQNISRAMRDCFQRHRIDLAVRIGSRINVFPLKDVYELKRSAVRGTDSFWEFKIKLKKGRAKLF